MLWFGWANFAPTSWRGSITASPHFGNNNNYNEANNNVGPARVSQAKCRPVDVLFWATLEAT